MKANTIIKMLVVGIIILLIGTSIVPIISGSITNQPETNVKNGVVNTYHLLGTKSEKTYEYVIITADTYKDAFQRLAHWKETRGQYTPYSNLSTKVVLLEDIVSNSSFWYNGYWGDGGNPNIFNDVPCQIRNFIKMAYNNWNTEYVLLGGDADEPVIPHRDLNIVGSTHDNDVPSDMYYGCLDGNWNNDGDSFFGESVYYGNNGEEADLDAEVYIGRAPVDNLSEANNFVKKTIAYENATAHDESYLKKMMMIKGKLGTSLNANEGDILTEITPQYTAIKVYHRDGTFKKSRMLEEMENGVHIVNHYGHAATYGFEGINIPDVCDLENENYFLVYSTGCNSAGFDRDDAVGEHYVTAPGGAFAYIGNSRPAGLGRNLQWSFFRVLLNKTLNAASLGKALQYAKEQVGSIGSSACYMLNLLGDPETQIKTEFTSPTARLNLYDPHGANLDNPFICNGTLTINGTARKGDLPGSTFDRYTIEIGEGNNPSEWTHIPHPHIYLVGSEVDDGALAAWDTTQIEDGLYTLRLTAYDNDGRTSYDDFVISVKNNATAYNVDKDKCYISIQEAIHDASQGDTIRVSGIHYESITINKPVKLIGDNAIIDSIGRNVITCYMRKSQVEIYGFTFRNNSNLWLFPAILIKASDNRVCGNTITGSDTGISVDQGYRNILCGNTISDCSRYGIKISSASNNIICHNNFIENSQNGIAYGTINTWDDGYPSGGNYWDDHPNPVDEYSGPGQNISGSDGIVDSLYDIPGAGNNKDRYPFVDMRFNVGIYGLAGIPIEGAVDEPIQFLSYINGANPPYTWSWDFGDGSFSNQAKPSHVYIQSGTYNVTLTVTDNLNRVGNATIAVVVRYDTVYVDDNYNFLTPGWGYNYFARIQDGIDAVAETGTVYVSSGIYNEAIIVNKNMALIGADKDTTVISPAAGDICVQFIKPYIQFSGFTVRDCTTGIMVESDAEYCTISDCHFTDLARSRAAVAPALKVYGKYLTISNCTFVNDDHGVGISSSGESEIRDCYFSGWNKAVKFGSAAGITFIDSIFSNNQYGIYVSGSAMQPPYPIHYNNVIGCTFSGNEIAGIKIEGSYNHVISCIFNGNYGSGIVVDGGFFNHASDNGISSCNFFNNAEYGIYLSESSENTITGSSITNNNHGIFLTGSSDNNLIYHNNFINNLAGNAYDEGNNYWDDGYPSGGNYWGNYQGVDNYSGPGQNISGPDGFGDTPYYISEESNPDHYPLMASYPSVDLIISDFTATKLFDISPSDIKITALIKNIGTTDVTIPFQVSFYRTSNASITQIGNVLIQSLGAGETAEATIYCRLKPEIYVISVFADSTMVIKESNENNNWASQRVSTKASTTGNN